MSGWPPLRHRYAAVRATARCWAAVQAAQAMSAHVMAIESAIFPIRRMPPVAALPRCIRDLLCGIGPRDEGGPTSHVRRTFLPSGYQPLTALLSGHFLRHA